MAYVYRSITLAAGESYVLPAGAELVGVNGSITDEAGCANLANVENLSCYVASIGAFSDTGDPQYGETESSALHPLVCKGIFQNGIYTPFITGDQVGFGQGTNGGCFDGNGIGTAVKGLMPGVIYSEGGSNPSSAEHSGQNCLTYVLIQTVPSLAENLYLWMAHSAPLDGPGTEATDFVIPFKTYQYYIDNGYGGLSMTCPTPAL
jgi:hypothetical protein